MAQELWAKAALVDHEKLKRLQLNGDIVSAENLLKNAFATDVRPAIAVWRKKQVLHPDPLAAFRKSGYERQAARERTRRRKELGIVQVGIYA